MARGWVEQLPAEAGPPFLTILLASCGSAAPVASGARRPERSRWRCGAPVGHGRLRLPQIIADWPCSFASRAFAVAGYRPRLRPTNDAGREVRRCHGGGPTRGDAVTDFPLIKAAKLWARVSARTGPGPCTRATTSAQGAHLRKPNSIMVVGTPARMVAASSPNAASSRCRMVSDFTVPLHVLATPGRVRSAAFLLPPYPDTHEPRGGPAATCFPIGAR